MATRRERTKTRKEDLIHTRSLDAVYTAWCRIGNKGGDILIKTVEKLKELGVQEIEISQSLMREFKQTLTRGGIAMVTRLSGPVSEREDPVLGEKVSLENARAYKTAKDKLLEGHGDIIKLTNEGKMLEFIKGESMGLSREINICFLNEKIVDEAETGSVDESDAEEGIPKRIINLLDKIITDKYDDDFYPIDIFPFNRIGLEIKKDAIRAAGTEIAGITENIIKGLAILIQDYLIGYIKSTTPIKKIYAFYGFLNKLANSDGLEMLLSLLIKAVAPYFSLKSGADEPTHGLLLYRGLIIFLLQLANSPPGGAEDVKEFGLNRGYEMFQTMLTKEPPDLYKRIIADDDCNTAWNAWLTNVTYAIFRNNSKGSGVFLQSDVPLLERGVRGRGAPGAMTRDVEMGLEPESDDETGSAAPPIGSAAPPPIARSKKKKTRRRRKSKGPNSTKGKQKRKGKKRKQTKRGRKKK